MKTKYWTRRLAALLLAGCMLGGLVPAGLAFAEEAPAWAAVEEAPLTEQDDALPPPAGQDAALPPQADTVIDGLAGDGAEVKTDGDTYRDFSITKVWQDGEERHPAVTLTLTATYTADGGDKTFDTTTIKLTQDDGNNWRWSGSMPTQVVVTTGPEGATSANTFDLTYDLEETQVTGYAPAEITASDDGLTFTVVNRRLTAISANLAWLDNGDTLATRPTVDAIKQKLTLHRGTPTEVDGVMTLEADNSFTDGAKYITVEEGIGDKAGTWTLKADGMPMTTDDGGAVYTYWFTLDGLDAGAATPSVLAPASTDQVTAKDPGAADVQYTLALENMGNYGNSPESETTRIYPEGTVTALLEGHTAFSVNKVWWDELTDTDEQEKNRPDATLTLWVYPDDGVHGPTTASPVLGKDTIPVERQIAVGTEQEHKFDHAGPDANGRLPLFDATGCMLVYFAREDMKAKNPDYVYASRIANPNTGAFQNVTDVLYNRGTIGNVRTGSVNLTATKQWKAQARQAMEAEVTLVAQRKVKNDAASFWADFQELVLEDFKAETPAKTGSFGSLPRFDEQGQEYEYQVVEDSISMSFGDEDKVSTARPDVANHITIEARKGSEVKYDGYNVTYEQKGDGWTVTNTLTYKTEVRVTKVWKQETDATRPDITLHLFQNGSELTDKKVTLKERDMTPGTTTIDDKTYVTWNYTFTDLDKFDGNGNEYDYSVTEDVDGGYHISYGYDYDEKDAEAAHIDITVTNDPVGPGASIAVRKVWLDDGDVQHRLPVTATAYKKEAPYDVVGSVVLDETSHWEGYIALPTDVSADEVAVRESEVGGYTVDYNHIYNPAGTAQEDPNDKLHGCVATGEHLFNVRVTQEDGVYVLTNLRVGGVNITVNKEWVDGGRCGVLSAGDIQAAGGPADAEKHTVEATFTLSGGPVSLDGTREKTLTGIGTAGTQTLTWTDLPKYDDKGKLYTYDVTETMDATSMQPGCDYQGSIAMDAYVVGKNHSADQMTYTAVNRRTGTVDPFQVHKIWLDEVQTPAESTAKRPNIYPVVKRSIDGGRTWQDVGKDGYLPHHWKKDTVTADTESLTWWTATFDPQPKYDEAGNLYDYTIAEGISGNAGGYAQYYYDTSPDADGGFDVDSAANARQTEGAAPNGTIVNRLEGTRTLNIRKYWKFGNNQLPAGDVPTALFDLYYKDGDAYQPAYFTLDTDMKGKAVLTLKTGGTDGLKAEAAVDAGQGNTGKFTVKDGGGTFTELPKYDTQGKEIAYYAKEKEVAGYTVSGANGDGYLDLGAATKVVDNSYKNDASVTVQLTKNTVGTPLTGDAGRDQLPTLTLKLQYQMQHLTDKGLVGTGVWKDYDALAGIIGGVESYTTKATDWNWVGDSKSYSLTHDFTGLPSIGVNGQPYLYRVIDNVDGYTPTATEAQGDAGQADVELTNTYTGGALTLRLTKTWAGQDENKYGDRPNLTVTVTRYLDGKLDKTYDAVTLTADKNATTDGSVWVWEVKNDENGTKEWPRYAPNGKPYTYKVHETVPDGYTGIEGEVDFVQDGTSNLFTAKLTNTLVPVSHTVTKTWAGDDAYAATLRPAAVTVQLQRSTNGTDWQAVADAVQLTEDGSWRHTWENLPQADKDGNAYTYRAVETGTSFATANADYSQAGAYDVTYNNSTSNTTAITNTLAVRDVAAVKVWADSSDYAGARPETVEFYLTTGDVNLDQSLRIDSDNAQTLQATDADNTRNEWKTSWTGLPARDKNGTPLSYLVKEKEDGLKAAGYSPSYNAKGDTVVNSRAVGATAVTVEKVWDGDSEALRPAQITVRLFADGRELTDKAITLPVRNEAGESVWRYTWEGLQKATAGGSTIRYTVQEDPVAGYDAAVQQNGSYFTITNTLQAGGLEISKTRLGGHDAVFTFAVTLTQPGKSPAAYAGPYTVTGADGAVRDAATADGTVALRGGETALLAGLPAGWAYAVEEQPCDGFRQTAAAGASGVITVNEVARAAFTNTAVTELEIDNITQNPGVQYAGAARPTNAGGNVRVTADTPAQPDIDPWQKDQTTVVWAPDAQWHHADSFTVRWQEFGQDDWHSITVTGWLDGAGGAKPITDPVYDGLRARFPEAAITMAGGTATLTLAPDAGTMPRRTHVDVRFTPTLAVENITRQDAGGTVTVRGGTAGAVSDGVPGQDGHGRYGQTVVTGIAAEGWAVQTNRITLGVPGSSAGDSPSAAVVRPDANGRFTATVTVPIAGTPTQVEVTGAVTFVYGPDGLAASATVTLDSLPVCLDIGIGFYQKGTVPPDPGPDPTPDPTPTPDPDPAPTPTPTPGGGENGGGSGNGNGGGTTVKGTPQTGDDSPVALFGLLLAIGAAGTAVTGILRTRKRKKQ